MTIGNSLPTSRTQIENANPGHAPVLSKGMTMCTACHASCSLVVEMEDGRPVKIYGNKDNPISHGYSCIRGRELYNYSNLPSRLRHSMARQPDGTFQPISSGEAMRQIAKKLEAIIAEHGPRAVAGYSGTCGWHVAGFMMNFLKTINSPMYFNCSTIDQPGKMIAAALHGAWLGGKPHSYDVDCVFLFGCNPLVSLMAPFGMAAAHNLKDAKRRNNKLIVCDPRRTETAQQAEIFLQPRPGEDFSVLAGMIHVVLQEKLFDERFVGEESVGLDELGDAVAPFTPAYVEVRTDVPAATLIAAARMYAGSRTGYIFCSTGPNMSGRGTLTEYLARVLMTLAGHFARAGDKVANPGVLFDSPQPIAATSGPTPPDGFGEKLRVHGLTSSAAGLPTSVLPDEILLEGDGRVRALIVTGGNPALAFPDQLKTFEAMRHLDLLVCIDPHMSATARLSHYVIAPKMGMETDTVASSWESFGRVGSVFGFDEPYQLYASALVPPPADSDVIDDWLFFYSVLKYMGRQMVLEPISSYDPEEATRLATMIDMEKAPTTDEIYASLFKTSPVPYEQVRSQARGGHIFDVPEKIVQAKPDGWSGRFQLADVSMMRELGIVAVEDIALRKQARPFLLISRRLKDIFNSCWHEHEPLVRKWRYNPAFMNPEDIAKLGIASGDIVKIESDRAGIVGIAEADATVKPGCISMAHTWGSNPGEPEDPYGAGSNTSRLISNDTACEPITWIPRMSAIPVSVSKAASGSRT